MGRLLRSQPQRRRKEFVLCFRPYRSRMDRSVKSIQHRTRRRNPALLTYGVSSNEGTSYGHLSQNMDINVPIEFVVEVCGARNVAVLHRGGTEPAWRTGRFRRFSIRKRTARWVPDQPKHRALCRHCSEDFRHTADCTCQRVRRPFWP
jgi:hypothetical protein